MHRLTKALLLLWFLLGNFSLAVADDHADWDEKLRRGRNLELLEELEKLEPGLAQDVYRLRSLTNDEQFNKALRLLDTLENNQISRLKEPLDFWFFLTRGDLEQVRLHYDLAAKNFREAERRADDQEQRILAVLAQARLKRKQGRLDAASVLMGQLNEAVDSELAGIELAEYLLEKANLDLARGLGSEALWSLQAAQLLFRQAGFKRRADRVVQQMGEVHEIQGNYAKAAAAYLKFSRLASENEDWTPNFRVVERLYMLAYRNNKLRPAVNKEVQRLLALKMPLDHEIRCRVAYASQQDDSRELWESELSKALERSQSPEQRAIVLLVWSNRLTITDLSAKAEKLLDEAKTLVEPQPFFDSFVLTPSLQSVHFLKGVVHLQQRRFRQAQESFLEAHRLGGIELESRFKIRRYALETSLALGDIETAEEIFEDGLREVEKLPTPGHRSYSLWAVLIELIPLSGGQYDKVLNTWLADLPPASKELALKLRRRPELTERLLGYIDEHIAQTRLGTDPRGVVDSYSTKALLLEFLGRLTEAELAAQEGLEALEGTELEERKANQTLMLARLAYLKNEPEKTLGHIKSASHFARVSHPLRRDGLAMISGFQHLHAGLAQESLPYFESVKWPLYQSWAQLGAIQAKWALGQRSESFQQAEVLLKEVAKSGDTALQTSLLSSLADWARSLGYTEKSKSYYGSALELASSRTLWLDAVPLALKYQAILQKTEPKRALDVGLQTLRPILELQDFLNDELIQGDEFDALVENTLALLFVSDRAPEAFEILRAISNANLLRSLDLSQLESGDPETDALVKKAQNLKNQLAQLRQADLLSKEEKQKVVADTKQELLLVLESLKQQDPELQQLVALPAPDLLALQGSLDQNTLMLEYFLGPERQFVVAVSSEDVSMRELQLNKAQLQALIDKCLAKIRANDVTANQSLDQLSTALLKPIATELEGRSEIRVIPTGPLWVVPFGALPWRGESLGSSHRVSLSTSADLVRSLQLKEVDNWNGQMLLVGAPPGANLPGATRELKNLKSDFPQSTLLYREEAKKESVIQNLPNHKVTHFATHAHIGANKALDNRLQLADGDLTVSEIYGLDFKPGSLVVLSACQTAVGESNGRQLTSLATAFTSAGASTVLASRWLVHDQAAEEFFLNFYEFLSQGNSRGESLRLTRQKMATHPRWHHPYYWASFCLVGDSR